MWLGERSLTCKESRPCAARRAGRRGRFGVRTVTPLDIGRLGYDLTDSETFRAWERTYEPVDAYPYQAETPVTVTVYRGRMAGVAASLDELIGVFDMVRDPRSAEYTPYLHPGDLIGLSVADLDVPQGVFPQPVGGDPSKGYGGMKDYPGEGIAFRSLTIEGPLLESDVWPPPGTRRLLAGVEFDEAGDMIHEVVQSDLFRSR